MFTDLHIHLLYGCDDGAKTQQEMFDMLNQEYEDGVRVICVTPHFHPGYFGDNEQSTLSSFYRLVQYASKYPNLELYLGNELHFSRNCMQWVLDGKCHTLNNTDYILVDFSMNEDKKEIVHGCSMLLNGGYIPVLGHVERYEKMDLKTVQSLKKEGVIMQMDTQSILGEFGLKTKMRSKKYLSKDCIDLISSDAHDLKRRIPGMSKCYEVIKKVYGKDYADMVCFYNGLNILKGREIWNNKDK